MIHYWNLVNWLGFWISWKFYSFSHSVSYYQLINPLLLEGCEYNKQLCRVAASWLGIPIGHIYIYIYIYIYNVCVCISACILVHQYVCCLIIKKAYFSQQWFTNIITFFAALNLVMNINSVNWILYKESFRSKFNKNNNCHFKLWVY